MICDSDAKTPLVPFLRALRASVVTFTRKGQSTPQYSLLAEL
jgi:hypothetical protein